MKNVFLVLLTILTIGGIGGTVYFFMQNKDMTDQLTTAQSDYSRVQSELNAIGPMAQVYAIRPGKVKSGDKVNPEDLIEISIPQSALSSTMITDKSQLTGRHWKIDCSAGTIVSKELLMAGGETTNFKYEMDIVVSSVPVATTIGDFVDFRIMLANGEDYVVLSHKEIIYLDTRNYSSDSSSQSSNSQQSGVVIKIYLTEEEMHVWNAALVDTAMYDNCAFMYISKYVDPGLNTDTVAFFPVTHEMENLININSNIVDKSRCINPTLRDHIDQQLGILSISTNEVLVAKFKTFKESYAAVIMNSGTLYKEAVNNGEEAPIGEGSESAGGSQDFQQQVSGAMDNLDESIDQITGGIE